MLAATLSTATTSKKTKNKQTLASQTTAVLSTSLGEVQEEGQKSQKESGKKIDGGEKLGRAEIQVK